MSALPPVEWSPVDFFVHGHFVSPTSIAPAVEDARIAVDAEAAILLVADERAVLRTLCAAVPVGRPEVDAFAEYLDQGSFLRKSRWRTPERSGARVPALQHLLLSASAGSAARRRFPFSIGLVLEELRFLTAAGGQPMLASWFGRRPALWVPAAVPPRLQEAPLSLALLLFAPRSHLAERDGVGVVELDAHLERLAVLINATAHANVRRDDVIMKRLDDRLDPTRYHPEIPTFEEAAQALVELAVDVSRSDVGACYTVDHANHCSHLRAVHPAPSARGHAWTYPSRLKVGSDALAAGATDEHLTLQVPPGLARRDLQLTGLPNATTDAAIELAAPLPGPLAAPSAPAIGVLSVARLDDAARPYGAYELAVLRNVALRLALIATTANATRAAQMFARLSLRGTRLRVDASHQTHPDESRPLPNDLRDALPSIQDALSTLGVVAQSGTITFRAALPASDAAAPPGLVLERVASYPPDIHADDAHKVQSMDEGGINWRVAITGRLRSAPDVEEDEDYVAHREDTRSQLCIPVFVEDRLTGVVNLESPVKHAFDAHVEMAQAAAEHIGLAIANVRLALATPLQEHATDVIRRAHDLTHVPSETVPEDLVLSPAVQEFTDALVNRIKSELDDLRYIRPPSADLLPATGDVTFPSLVRHCIERLAMRGVVVLEVDDVNWRPHQPAAAAVIAKALLGILDNVRHHKRRRSRPARIVLSGAEWGGQRQDALVVDAVADEVLAETQVVNIYRCPVRSEQARIDSPLLKDRPHLGAYLAGLQLRRIGGDVHMAYIDGDVARVTVQVPSPLEFQGGSSGDTAACA